MSDQPLVEAGLRCPAGVFVLDQADALNKIVRRESVPSTVGGWQALADGLLTDKACSTGTWRYLHTTRGSTG